jgi:hypothetical protein
VPKSTRKGLSASDRRLKDSLKYLCWSAEELHWLTSHRPDLPDELRVLVHARLCRLGVHEVDGEYLPLAVPTNPREGGRP